eukprot:1973200-Rhodomonas_salina.1
MRDGKVEEREGEREEGMRVSEIKKRRPRDRGFAAEDQINEVEGGWRMLLGEGGGGREGRGRE